MKRATLSTVQRFPALLLVQRLARGAVGCGWQRFKPPQINRFAARQTRTIAFCCQSPLRRQNLGQFIHGMLRLDAFNF